MAAHRVAFVLSGQTRSFTDDVTRNSIRQNAIDALCPSPAECAAVLFLCAELGECRGARRRRQRDEGSVARREGNDLRAAAEPFNLGISIRCYD